VHSNPSAFNDAISIIQMRVIDMKTSNLISLLTAAVSALNNATKLYRDVTETTSDEPVDFEEKMNINPHLFLSYPCDVVRQLYKELPEQLKTEEASKAFDNLYPHMYKDKMIKIAQPALILFHFAHDISQERYAAMERFGLTDS
jgi:hypothetical protein